jgi:hypothetical protein
VIGATIVLPDVIDFKNDGVFVAVRRSNRIVAATTAAALFCAVAGAVGSSSALATSSPPEGAFFSTASVEESSTTQTASNGDLWPSCWSSDGNLYTANGDGKGFSTSGSSSDIAVSKVSGGVSNLTGTTVATGNALGQVWTAGSYNRKPTGMVCAGGAEYLAVQDLNTSFNDAPAATIAKSTDGGVTWTWNHTTPMFSNHVFTTVFFADYGQNNVNSPDGYVYAYGLDDNWRTSYDNSVPNPTDLYLARVPSTSIQDISTWQFYSGMSGSAPTWSSSISARQPVLHDDRLIYPSVRGGLAHNLSVLGQGGVLYDAPLNRYLYSSWTEFTYEFYESATPYGPWSHFMTKDFGAYPWTTTKNGGYATTIPSKFLSADGRTMYVQSNVCSCANGGVTIYDYALRKFTVAPSVANTASNGASNTTNLAQSAGTVPIERVAHYGNNTYYNDGILTNSEDDWNQENKGADSSWWGYTWPHKYNLNTVVYTTGTMFPDGGWFASGLRVQVRSNGVWTNVSGEWSSPGYIYSTAAGANTSYTFTFPTTSADGVRVIGTPGGSDTFTSVGEVSAYDAGGFAVGGAIATEYSAVGGTSGILGYPITNELTAADGVGRYNHFQKDGSIYWTPSTGAHEVNGVIHDKWASLGWERGVLGYPTSDEMSDPQGRRSNFQNGYIIYNSSTGIATAYNSGGTVI